MKKKFILFLLCIFVSSSIVTASNLTPREFAMGGAFTASVNDSNSLLYNPAGLASNNKFDLKTSVGTYNIDIIEKLVKQFEEIDAQYKSSNNEHSNNFISLNNTLNYSQYTVNDILIFLEQYQNNNGIIDSAEGLIDAINAFEQQEGIIINDFDESMVYEFEAEHGDVNLESITNIITDNMEEAINLDFLETNHLNIQSFTGTKVKNVAVGLNIINQLQSHNNDKIKSIENTLTTEGIIGYGRHLLNYGPAKISGGINLKYRQYYNHKINFDLRNIKTSLQEGNGTNYDFDLGLQAKLTNFIRVGAVVKDVLNNRNNFVGKTTDYDYNLANSTWEKSEAVEHSSKNTNSKRKYKLGASFKVPLLGVTINGDIKHRKKTNYHIGAEKNVLFNGLSIRAGAFTRDGNLKNNYYTAGLGVNLLTLRLDAAIGANEYLEEKTVTISGDLKF
ncbi:MAG: hypothetical protein ACOCQR_01355 [bacterium]